MCKKTNIPQTGTPQIKYSSATILLDKHQRPPTSSHYYVGYRRTQPRHTANGWRTDL